MTYMCPRHVLFLGAILWLEPTLDVCCRYVKGVSLATYFRELRKCADGPGGRYKILGAAKECCKQILKVSIINHLMLLSSLHKAYH